MNNIFVKESLKRVMFGDPLELLSRYDFVNSEERAHWVNVYVGYSSKIKVSLLKITIDH